MSFSTQQKLIFALKASENLPTVENYEKLISSGSLFDESLVNKSSEEYRNIYTSFEKAVKYNDSIVTYIDDEYPERLKRASNPPSVLYCRGDINALTHSLYAGFVGSRACDVYGLEMTKKIACDVAETGVGIISGGAKGVDSASHRGALSAKARTIAVMGSGLDELYPECNISLFEEIASNGGLLVSEFPYGTSPERWNFPQRNRIIAAVSNVLAVMRAGARSGSIISANLALSYNVPVFAMPGNINDKLSSGTNNLLRDGAIPILSSMDIIDELILSNPDFFERENGKDFSEKLAKNKPLTSRNIEERINNITFASPEEEIIHALKEGYDTQELIESQVTFNKMRLTGILSMMELKGIIKKGLDKKYKL